MKLKGILRSYHEALDVQFGKNEVDSFFNLLIEHYLQLKRINLIMEPNHVVTDAQAQLLFQALEQLKLEEPIQYIIGETEFYGLSFKVNTHTLIPRPETEELVDWIKSSYLESHTEQSRSMNEDSQIEASQFEILDIGTGSGCIAITLAKHILKAKVSALDVSEEALKIAEQNAKLNNVEVQFIHDDILKMSYSARNPTTKYDIIVSNPPYVRHLEKAEIKANVLNNEPHLALFVEDYNPLQFYKAICEFAQLHLKTNGLLYFEINEYLGDEMVQLLKEFDFKAIELKKDMFGKDRMIKAIQ